MGNGGGGRAGAVPRSRIGLSQADNQVSNQLGKMSSPLQVAKPNLVQFVAPIYPRQPILDDTDNTTLEYRGHSGFFHPGSGFAGKRPLAGEFGEFPRLKWFHDDFIRFQ